MEIYVQVHSSLPSVKTESDNSTTMSSIPTSDFLKDWNDTQRVPSQVELDCENMKREHVRGMLFDAMPAFDMPEIPYYTPFPFELVCLCTEKNGWCRANIIQFTHSANDEPKTVDVFLVDIGTTVREVQIDRLKPVPREFALRLMSNLPLLIFRLVIPPLLSFPLKLSKLHCQEL